MAEESEIIRLAPLYTIDETRYPVLLRDLSTLTYPDPSIGTGEDSLSPADDTNN